MIGYIAYPGNFPVRPAPPLGIGDKTYDCTGFVFDRSGEAVGVAPGL